VEVESRCDDVVEGGERGGHGSIWFVGL
jgi:hypothetical protein